MPSTIHWFDFETKVTIGEEEVPVMVEATISADSSNVQALEGVKVKLLRSGVELVLSDKQMRLLDEEIWERCHPDEPGDDWRTDWGDHTP